MSQNCKVGIGEKKTVFTLAIGRGCEAGPGFFVESDQCQLMLSDHATTA